MEPRLLHSQPPTANWRYYWQDLHQLMYPRTIVRRDANEGVNFWLKKNQQSCELGYAYTQFAKVHAYLHRPWEHQFALFAMNQVQLHLISMERDQVLVGNFS